MNAIVLKYRPTVAAILTDFIEAAVAVLIIWKGWPNRYTFLLGLCAAAILLYFRIRNYGRNTVITPDTIRKQRRYAPPKILSPSDYSGVGIAVTRVGSNHLRTVVQIAFIPRNKLAEAEVVYESDYRGKPDQPVRHEEAERLTGEIAALTGLQNHGILGWLTADEWYYLAHKRPGSPDLFGYYQNNAG